MSGRNGRVSREDGTLPHQFTGFRMAVTGGDELSNAFNGEKGGVAFVAMPHSRVKAESP